MFRAAFQSLPRGTLYSLLLLSAFVNANFFEVTEHVAEKGLVSALLSGGAINPILLFAALWAAWRLARIEIAPLSPRWGDWAIVAIVIALIYVPMTWFSWIAVTVVGVRVMRSSKQLGGLIAYMAVPGFWGLIPVKLIGAPILVADAFVVSLAAGYPVNGNTIIPTGAENTVTILWGCSSVHGISYMVLAWLVLASINRVRPFANWPLLLVGLAGVVLINWTRLFFMVRYEDLFDYLHSGTGSQYVAMATLVWMVTLPILASSRRVAA
ncbi:hypothetical protein CKO11_03465 [Rhodobacter sp. TJ_12]|nr:hypothetical protein [Rhodobacter sp. TJ_12]